VSRCLPIRYSAVVGFILLSVHQLALSALGLSDFIFWAPRVSLWSQNKEGLASLGGFFALYLIAVPVGALVLRTKVRALCMLSGPVATF
jgi:hypothetical protein